MVIKNNTSSREALALFFLRSGLALVFFYASISAFLNPQAWIGFIPSFIKVIMKPETFLHLHSIGELALGLWLLSDKKIFYAAIVSVLSIASIIIFNFTALDVVFRDLAILFAGIALAILSYRNR